MIRELREAFTSMLAETTWMDKDTRKLAIAKVQTNVKTCRMCCVSMSVRAKTVRSLRQ